MNDYKVADRLNEALGVLDALNENNEIPYPDYALLYDLIDAAAAQLAEHDRQVKAEAWAEGYGACADFVDGPDWATPPVNPYLNGDSK